MDVASEELPEMWIGEDATYTFKGTARSDPLGWTLRADFIPFTGTTAVISGVDIVATVTESGGGLYITEIAVTILHAKSILFGAGTGRFQLVRTDTPHITMLAQGSFPVVQPPAALAA